MNLLYRAGSSKDNFQLNILEELRRDGVFDKCTVISQTLDGGDKYPEEFYHELKGTSFYFGRYEEICDIENLPSVPLNIWEDMLKYKDNVLNMTMRPFNAHIYNYFEMDIIYSRAVRFWNYILDTDKIDMCFMTVAPHTPWEYVLYALCKIKKIPTLIVDEHWMPGLGTVFTDLDHNGYNAKVCYDKHSGESILPNDKMQAWYDNCVKTRISYNKAGRKADKDFMRTYYRQYFYSYWYKDAWGLLIQIARRVVKGKKVAPDLRFYREIIRRRHMARKVYYKTPSIAKYDKKYAEAPVAGEEYILYLLQFVPEATLLPKSGVCSNQIIAARILAKGAEKAGVKLYVKEHYAQVARHKTFYEELAKIPNIRIIKLSEPTGPLQDNAIAVASQTGRCLLESMVKCKPFFSLAYNAVAEAPGAFMIRSEDDVVDAVSKIKAGMEISEEDTKRFFGAVYKTSVKCKLDYGINDAYDYKEVADDTVTLIKAFVNAGMPDDFYFERMDN